MNMSIPAFHVSDASNLSDCAKATFNATSIELMNSVGFAMHDRTGARVAYRTGPLRSGSITVMPK